MIANQRTVMDYKRTKIVNKIVLFIYKTTKPIHTRFFENDLICFKNYFITPNKKGFNKSGPLSVSQSLLLL